MISGTPVSAPREIRYHLAVRLFHWITVLLLVLGFLLAWGSGWIEDWPTRLFAVQTHRMIGLTILAIAVIRIIIRMVVRQLPEGGTPKWMRRVSGGVAGLFYFALVVIPLTGWAYTNATGLPVAIFGNWSLPSLFFKDEYFTRVFFAVHETLALALLALAALHVSAALWHGVIMKDDVNTRMKLFSFRRSARPGRLCHCSCILILPRSPPIAGPSRHTSDR